MRSWMLSMIAILAGCAAACVATEDAPYVRHGVPQYSIAGVSGWTGGAATSGSNATAAAAPEWPRGTRRRNRYHPQCDVAARAGVCLHDGRTVLVPDAVPAGTVGLYAFDENVKGVVVDRSGNGNHGIAGPVAPAGDDVLAANSMSPGHAGAGSAATRSKRAKTAADAADAAQHNPVFAPAVPAAPDRLGGAASAHFDGHLYYRVPPSASLASLGKAFTASLWVLLADETVASSAGACPVFAVGDNALYLTSSRHVNVAIPGLPVTTSGARLRAGQWTHLTLAWSAAAGEFSLLVNGVPDTTVKPPQGAGPAVDAHSAILIGGAPGSDCTSLSLLVDDVRITARPPAPERIASEAAPALGGATPAFVQVGCGRRAPCAFDEARQSCPVGAHLCSERELTAGGAYAQARQLGWIGHADPLWTADAGALRAAATAAGDAARAEAVDAQLNEPRVSLCCLHQ